MKPRVDATPAAPPDRRKDQVMADLVEIGLLYVDVFGRERGLNFFRCTVVAPHVYRRVLLGTHRQAQAQPGDLACAG